MAQTVRSYGQHAWPSNVNKALLLVRIVLGALFVGHAGQKLFGWFGGQGIGGFVGSLEKLGIQPAPFWAYFEATAELVCGVLLVLGLLTPLAAAVLIADMVVAVFEVHWPKGLWSQQGGFEYNLVLAAVLFAIGLTGPGIYSLDNRMPFALPRPYAFLVALLASVAVVVLFVIAP
ncbi:MAG TPA: DoxX family protein [Chloroflexota bacterium]|nr:DoxX family protein [Chloroflexota bacterium]